VITTQSLELFIDFVRKNPWLPPNDPVMMRAFNAYTQEVSAPEVPEVEVTESAFRNAHGDVGQPVPTSSSSLDLVAVSERPVEGRRSAAKNLSDPKYQTAFISEARTSMGMPSPEDAEALVNHKVLLIFNVDKPPVSGVLLGLVYHPSMSSLPYLELDEGEPYPISAIQEIRDMGSAITRD